MITATFKIGGDTISVKVEKNNLFFFDVGTGQVSTLEGLRMSKAGVLKEHPDLKGNIGWKKIATERLKEHVKKIKTEMEKIIYVKNELKKFGYEPLFYAKQGFRTKKFEEKE